MIDPIPLQVIPGELLFLATIGTFAGIFGLLALGLNVHFGYTGLLNFGHVAFFAAGAYASAFLTMPPSDTVEQAGSYAVGLGLPMPLGLPISLLVAAVAGGVLAAIIGLTSVRLETHYLAIATFALAQLFHSVLINEQWLTRGNNGLNTIPRPGYGTVLETDVWLVAYFLFVVATLVGMYLLLERLVDAPFGRVLRGIREDETAARALGKRTNRLKLTSFILGGAISGFAGGLYAHYLGAITPSQFLPIVTFLVWVMVIIGGTASNFGVIVGAVALIAFRDLTGTLPSVPGYPLLIEEMRWALIGLILIVLMRLRPEGLFGNPEEITFTEEGEQ
jgi:branched-chain amino acid transport system permease protein